MNEIKLTKPIFEFSFDELIDEIKTNDTLHEIKEKYEMYLKKGINNIIAKESTVSDVLKKFGMRLIRSSPKDSDGDYQLYENNIMKRDYYRRCNLENFIGKIIPESIIRKLSVNQPAYVYTRGHEYEIVYLMGDSEYIDTTEQNVGWLKKKVMIKNNIKHNKYLMAIDCKSLSKPEKETGENEMNNYSNWSDAKLGVENKKKVIEDLKQKLAEAEKDLEATRIRVKEEFARVKEEFAEIMK